MKASISIPNPIYEAAERLAQSRSMSLGELYTAALTAYVTAHQRGEVTEVLNRVYETESSALEPIWVNVQLASVDREPW